MMIRRNWNVQVLRTTLRTTQRSTDFSMGEDSIFLEFRSLVILNMFFNPHEDDDGDHRHDYHDHHQALAVLCCSTWAVLVTALLYFAINCVCPFRFFLLVLLSPWPVSLFPFSNWTVGIKHYDHLCFSDSRTWISINHEFDQHLHKLHDHYHDCHPHHCRHNHDLHHHRACVQDGRAWISKMNSINILTNFMIIILIVIVISAIIIMIFMMNSSSWCMCPGWQNTRRLWVATTSTTTFSDQVDHHHHRSWS